MGIRLKLTLFLLLFGFIILGALVWSNEFILHKTMLHYIDERDQQHLERLQSNIESYIEYEVINKIDEIQPSTWMRLVHVSGRIDLKQNPMIIPLVMGKRGPPAPPRPPYAFEQRISLISNHGHLIFGAKPDKNFFRLPIVLDGKVVAYIGYRPLKELMQKTDIQFAKSQLKILTFGAVLISLLALILLWPLANHFLMPIRQLTKAMHDLASGNLKLRLKTTRKDELGELQRDFNHLATTLEAAQSSRNQWVADISHELRTPLTVINGSIEAMLDGIRPLNSENLHVLQKEAALLTRLIEDLYQLSLSDVGALQYHMQPVDLTTLVKESYENFSAKAQAKGLTLKLCSLCNLALIKGDSERLLQLLINLLQNAIHYTDAITPEQEKGRIEISLLKQNKHYVFIIEDTAPGVTLEEIPSLSERFYRSEKSRNRSTGGAGLGLAMVSKIIQAHQGELLFSQSDLGGLKVTVKLPALPA